MPEHIARGDVPRRPGSSAAPHRSIPDAPRSATPPTRTVRPHRIDDPAHPRHQTDATRAAAARSPREELCPMTQHTASSTGAARRSAVHPGPVPPRPVPRHVARTLFGETVPVPVGGLRIARSREALKHLAAQTAQTDERPAHPAPLRAAPRDAVDGPESPLALSAPVLLDECWNIDRFDPARTATLSRVR